MYGHPGQNFIPHSTHLNQQYCGQNISQENYGYDNASPRNLAYQIPPPHPNTNKEDQQQHHHRSTSSSATQSVIVEVHGDDDDDDVEPDYIGNRKRLKTSKNNDNNKGGRSADLTNTIPSKVGRHQDEVRTLFRYDNGMWFCPICNQSVSPRAGRMKTHFEKCRTLAEYRIAKEVDSIGEISTVTIDGLNSSECEESSESTSLSCNNFHSNEPPSDVKKTTKNVKSHGGRIKSDVWNHYEEKQGMFYCKRCTKRVSSKAHRLTQHLATACVDSPSFIAAELRKVGLRPSNESTMTECHEIRQQFDFRNGQWACQKCQKVVSSSVDHMKKHLEIWCGITPDTLAASSGPTIDASTSPRSVGKKQDAVMMKNLLGKFIFSSNLPFSIVENPQFVAFVKAISRNNFTPPSVADLGGSILTEIQTELVNEMSKVIGNKCVTLVQYGWSVISADVQGKRRNDEKSMPFEEYNPKNYLIIHGLHNGQRSFFLNATEISEEDSIPHTCLKLLDSSMDYATKQYNCKFVGVLTDVAARESIHESHPTLHVYGCYKDVFNLLGKELARSDIINPVLQVQEYFSSRLSIADHAIFEGIVIVTPTCNDNDWKKQLDTIQSFSTNIEKYREAVSTTATTTFHVTDEIKTILENRDLCEKVEQLLFVLTRLDQAYKKVNNDTSVIADAVRCWLDLMNSVYICTSHDEKIKEGFKQWVTPMAIAAYLLHPVYRGENMDLELQEVGRLWLLDRDPMYVVFQSALERGDTTCFPASSLNKTVAQQMGPAVWWEYVSKWPKIPEGLANLAVSLMILPATNMVSEYFPAIVKKVSSQKKSLGWEKTLQLCKAYFDLDRKQSS